MKMPKKESVSAGLTHDIESGWTAGGTPGRKAKAGRVVGQDGRKTVFLKLWYCEF